MKQLFILTILSLILLVGNAQTDTTTIKKVTSDTTKLIYTCSMHPEIQSDKPGNCPKCGMTLIVSTKGSEQKRMMMPGMMMGGGMMGHNKSGKKFPWGIVTGALMVVMMVFIMGRK